jgi:hypothetical protein
MNADAINELARRHGAAYTNRHAPNESSFGFMDKALHAFANEIWGTAVAAERERALGVLAAEVERGRALAHVHGKDGAPIYDTATVQACIETIEFCANRIRSEK